jgi:transcriptional regulator with XRE-family HTH domain
MKYRVKEICKSKGLRMEDLAQKLGITRNALTNSLARNITISNLERIASALNVSITELFDIPSNTSFACPKCGAELRICADTKTTDIDN